MSRQQFTRTLRLRLHRRLGHAKVLAKRFKNAALSWRTLVSICGILLMLVLFCGAIMPVRYDIAVGMVPKYTITANRDVVDEITTESLRNAAAAAVQPTYHYTEGVTESVIANFDDIFTQMKDAVQYSQTLEDYGPTRFYTNDELAYARTILTLLELRDYQLRTLLNTSPNDLTALYTTLYAALQNTMASHVTQGQESVAVDSILKIVGYSIGQLASGPILLQNIATPLLNAVIRPNMVIDQEATEAARQLARDSVEPVVYKQGQNIVVKGEGHVERYQYDMLSNLGLLNDDTIDISIYLGAGLLIVLVMFLAMVLLHALCPQITADYRRLILLFSVCLVTLLLCILMRLINIRLAPTLLCAILLTAMLGLPTGLIFNVAIAVLVSALAAGGSGSYAAEMVQLLSCTLCSGTLAALILNKHSNRLRVIAAGVAASTVNFLIMLALGLMTSSLGTSLLEAAQSMGAAGISAVLCLAFQPLLEAMFNLPTPTKLMELSNPNHPLLRRLLLEAPGTYHHSILVANLAEASAEAIGANPLLARVGGYYHDVGKLRRPVYFKENQLGADNRLSELDPYTAAQIVLSHTRDGVTLARNYRLPREVTQIILEHHGNTPAMYFYTQAVKNADGKPVDIADYRYDCNPPATREGAIVLLCDTIEAAVRSMQNPTPDAIDEFIVKLVRGKLQDGQLSNSQLTLKDIDNICHACATVLNGVFHERIEYPDPPAQIPAVKEQAAAIEAPIAVDEPWDGGEAAKEDLPETPTRSILSDPPAPESTHTKPVYVEPELFETPNPLPVVEPPAAVAPVSVAEVLRDQHDEDEMAQNIAADDADKVDDTPVPDSTPADENADKTDSDGSMDAMEADEKDECEHDAEHA